MRLIEDSLVLAKDIKENHFMNYPEYCETKLLSYYDDDSFCYKCKKRLEPLTYCEPDFYYQPCWDCSNKRKSDRELVTEGLLRGIRDFYSKILGDRYFQLFIVDDIYFRTTFPHTYPVFKKVVNSLDPPNRNDIWFLDWVPGYPKIISLDNLQGIKIVNLTDKYGQIELDKDVVKVGDYEVSMPEPTLFDPRHHTRYSILNKNGDRKSKRMKIGDKCIRFYNTEDDNVKAIFKITKNGEEIAIRSLSHQDFVIIKLAMMRNKNFLRLIFDIVQELSKSIGVLRDTIFLKNSVILDPKKSDISVNLIWTPLSDYKMDNSINISIL